MVYQFFNLETNQPNLAYSTQQYQTQSYQNTYPTYQGQGQAQTVYTTNTTGNTLGGNTLLVGGSNITGTQVNRNTQVIGGGQVVNSNIYGLSGSQLGGKLINKAVM